MKTATHALTATFGRSLFRSLVAVIAASVSVTVLLARDPPTVPQVDEASPAPAPDPYVAYLESLESRDATCHAQSVALRKLLTEREAALHEFFNSTVTDRPSIITRLDALDRQIGEVENMLESAVAATQPGDAPDLAPLPVVDFDAVRQQSKRWRRPIYPPAPARLVVPELPTPPGESLYLDYLAERAGDSEFAQTLVADVAHLLHERRELAYRHAHSRAHERERIENTMRAVSLHVRITSRAAAEGVKVSNW